MLHRIPLPKGLNPEIYAQLRAYADWYLGQVQLHGPAIGSRRSARIRRNVPRRHPSADPILADGFAADVAHPPPRP